MTAGRRGVVAGLCGIAVSAAVLLFERQRGVVAAQQWEEALVFGAATAAIMLSILKRR